MARGKNPWLWGIAALVLGLLPFDQLRLLSLAPVLYLMVFVRPMEQRTRQTQRNACSKCASPHSQGQNFCTKCGWDLSREYTPEGGDTVLASEMHQPQAAPTATMERPTEPPQESPSQPAAARPQEDVAPVDDASAAAPSHEHGSVEGTSAATEAVADHEPDLTESEPEPEAQPRPWGFPQPSAAPTAEVMTARGATLLVEGKLQEAIDQFTKAIALDPRHREAFERRAEAYTKQGRGERAEEDYRHIQALIAGS